MAGRTSKTSAKVAKKAAAQRVAAKPTFLAGGNPQIANASSSSRAADCHKRAEFGSPYSRSQSARSRQTAGRSIGI
jgi:hypothetical protein